MGKKDRAIEYKENKDGTRKRTDKKERRRRAHVKGIIRNSFVTGRGKRRMNAEISK